jgi:PAS domain S-box-containing protein
MLVEQQEWQIIGIIALCAGALLIVALLTQQQRRRRTETELHDSEERMTLAATAAKLGIWVWDITHDQIWVTDPCRALYGFAPAVSLDYQAFLNSVHPDDRESTQQAIQHALTARQEYHCEYRVILPDGRIRWIAAQGRGYFDSTGKPLRLMGVSIDVTTHKQAELEIQRQRQELAHVTRVATLGELSAALAHELNQPLTAILSNAQAALRFLAQTPPDLEELRAILQDIVQDDQRAGEVVRRLRVLFKKEETPRRVLDLNAMIREVGQLLRSDLLAKHVSLVLDLAADLPAVIGDPVQLQQVVLNLLLNGAEALCCATTCPRQLQVRTGWYDVATLEITVRDTGAGFDPSQLEHCFEPFVTTKPQGLGMGLAISRSIVTAHGGRLWATNNPDGGATLHCTLPISQESSR